MKKSSVSIILLFLFIVKAASAQTQKGDQNLGLSLGFYSSSGNYNYQNAIPGSYGSQNTTSFSSNPNYSYFVANNLDIGLSAGFGKETDNYNDHTSDLLTAVTTRNYSGTLYIRKYFLYKGKVGIRTGPYLSYQYFTSATTYVPNSNQQNYYVNGKNYQAGINAEFVYFPSHKIGLALNLGSLYYNHNIENTTPQNYSLNTVNLQFLNNNLVLSAFYVFGN